MIKGEIQEITLIMSPEEVSEIINQLKESEIINIMGKRYAIRRADCFSGIRHYSGEYKTRVKLEVQLIKKGN